MTELKFLWGVKLRIFILSPAFGYCWLCAIGPIEKNVFSADVDL